MKTQLQLGKGTLALVGTALLVILLAMALLKPRTAQSTLPAGPHGTNSPGPDATVELSPSQLDSVKIEPVGTHHFPVEKEAVGSIGFVDDLSVQVFPPYQGRILKSFVDLGDDVEQGQALYNIDSPDLIQAESALIGAAATLDLTTKELMRAKDLYTTNFGVSAREVEQATSDQQTAEGALRAARNAVRVFGKSDAEIDQLVAGAFAENCEKYSPPGLPPNPQ